MVLWFFDPSIHHCVERPNQCGLMCVRALNSLVYELDSLISVMGLICGDVIDSFKYYPSPFRNANCCQSCCSSLSDFQFILSQQQHKAGIHCSYESHKLLTDQLINRTLLNLISSTAEPEHRAV